MNVTVETMTLIRRAVRRECGCQIRPEERFDIGQEIAIKLLANEPKDVEVYVAELARNVVADRLRAKRTEREALEHLYTVGAAPRYNLSLKRDPLANYMAIKPVLRGSGENDVEDAVIAMIDARAKSRKGPKRVPTCPQDFFAWRYMLAKQLRHLTPTSSKKTRI